MEETKMKKIMFNDRYGLTKAVLESRKTMTRRFIQEGVWQRADVYSHKYYEDTLDLLPGEALIEFSPFKPGEVVAVAQSLRDMGYDPRDTKHKSGAIWGLDHTPAWTNKMFVSASECIHQIRITNIRVERLQDISDEDCYKEGIMQSFDAYHYKGFTQHFNSAREAFADLIDEVSGKGTWEANPWVYVYEFELVK
jgi:hypothetical protein